MFRDDYTVSINNLLVATLQQFADSEIAHYQIDHLLLLW